MLPSLIMHTESSRLSVRFRQEPREDGATVGRSDPAKIGHGTNARQITSPACQSWRAPHTSSRSQAGVVCTAGIYSALRSAYAGFGVEKHLVCGLAVRPGLEKVHAHDVLGRSAGHGRDGGVRCSLRSWAQSSGSTCNKLHMIMLRSVEYDVARVDHDEPAGEQLGGLTARVEEGESVDVPADEGRTGARGGRCGLLSHLIPLPALSVPRGSPSYPWRHQAARLKHAEATSKPAYVHVLQSPATRSRSELPAMMYSRPDAGASKRR